MAATNDIILYGGIGLGVIVVILLLFVITWYCRRRRTQNAIDDALRDSQSYINNTTHVINHTLHNTVPRDSGSTNNPVISKLNSNSDREKNGINRSNFSKNSKQQQAQQSSNGNGSGGDSSPNSNDIVLAESPVKTEMLDSPNVDTRIDLNGTNTMNNNNNNGHPNIINTKDSSQDGLLANKNTAGTSSNPSTPVIASKAPPTASQPHQIVSLKQGGATTATAGTGNGGDIELDIDGVGGGDSDADKEDEINRIMNEEIDNDTMKRLTLHKKLSNINVRQKILDDDLGDDLEDEEEEEDSLNDDLLVVEPKTHNSILTGAANRDSGAKLLSPESADSGNSYNYGNSGGFSTFSANNNNNNNNNSSNANDKSGGNKHRRMVSQEDIDYFDKMKEETVDDTRDFRSRTISTNTNTANAKLVEQK